MKTSFLFLALLLANLTTIGQNNPPVAVNDTVNGVAGNPVYVTQSFLLQNDYDPDDDSIFIKYVFGFQKVNDSTWLKNIEPYSTDAIIKARYIIRDEHNTNSTVTDNIIIHVKGAVRFDSLDVNNINALISPVGQHFWDFETAHFEVPKGSGKQSVFSHTVWIGGINDGDTLCTAAECYRQTGADFFVGPITNGFDSNYYIKWNRVWKLDKEQIRYHINNWNQPAYSPIDAIKNWPANGDIALGQSPQIAPFYDKNTNGTYEPMQGDYPLIRGDQAVFFVFNDINNIHTESKGYPLGIEILGMAYGYNRPDDSTLNNTLFMHYDIINRSVRNYHDTYLGFFTDFDLGFASDDFIGSDVTNGMIYCYNGTNTDGTGQPASYGEHPPAIGLKVIGGPFLEPDGIDNPSGECGYSLNGLNFGDNVVDNERFGMTNFFIMNNSENGYMTEPEVAIQYYNYMISYWMDGTQMLYGGNGHNTTGGVGPECNFMFPGNSDTICNFGTNGIPPNGGYNQNGYYWTENTTGNAPGDRRGVASVGPFNFSAGETVPLDYCFTWARDYQGDNNSSVELLRERIAALTPDWNNLANIPLTYYGVPENTKEVSHLVYPNPVHEKATIVVDGSSKQPFQLYSITGELILHGILNPGNNLLDISTLKPGVYILKSGSRNIRIVKM